MGLSGGDGSPEPVSRAELVERPAEGSVTLLDVRPADEYAAGHSPGALHDNLAELECILPSLAPDTEVVAYCRGPYCIYAHQAVTALRKRGLKAWRMDGGLPKWREEGRSVVTVLQD